MGGGGATDWSRHRRSRRARAPPTTPTPTPLSPLSLSHSLSLCLSLSLALSLGTGEGLHQRQKGPGAHKLEPGTLRIPCAGAPCRDELMAVFLGLSLGREKRERPPPPPAPPSASGYEPARPPSPSREPSPSGYEPRKSSWSGLVTSAHAMTISGGRDQKIVMAWADVTKNRHGVGWT